MKTTSIKTILIAALIIVPASALSFVPQTAENHSPPDRVYTDQGVSAGNASVQNGDQSSVCGTWGQLIITFSSDPLQAISIRGFDSSSTQSVEGC